MRSIAFLSFLLLTAAVFASGLELDGRGDFLLEGQSGSLYILDRNHQPLKLNVMKRENGMVLENGVIRWEISVGRQEILYALEGTVVNNGKEQLWLEPGLSLTVPRKAEDYFWGGFDVLPAGEKPLARKGFKGRTSKHIGGGLTQPFATSSLISGRSAYILGQPPFELCSYNAASYQPLTDHQARIDFSQRIVLEPGQKIPLRFSAGVAPVRFGCEENVVQAFYDAYPARFRPFVGRDNPYVWGTHSQYRAWYFRPDREKERRYYATIDWAYTPYKRSGDYFGRKEFWDYQPLVSEFKVGFGQFANGIPFDYKKMSLEEFHKTRKAIYAKNGMDFGYSFYFSVGWCEENLAKKYYPDALTYDTSVPLKLGPWSTHHDREVRVLPYGNSFGDQTIKNLQDLTAELEIPGFALDCGTPGVIHRNAAARNPEMPGRAWDEKGLFADELCATIALIDYIHGMRPEKPYYIWKNGQGPCDYAMIETDLFGSSFKSWMPLYRYNVAQRHAVIHLADAYMFNETIPDWRNLSLPEFMTQWKMLGDYLLLADFEYGMSEAHASYGGNPQCLYCLPELLECLRNGWMALVPVEFRRKIDFLQTARYGRGADTILYFGNPWDEVKTADLRVDNQALRGGFMFFLPKMRDFATAFNRIEKGDTCFRASFPSRRPALYEAFCSLSRLPEDGALEAQVSSRKDLDRIVFTAVLQNRKPFRTAVSPRWIHRYAAEILVNGRKIAAGEEVLLPAKAELKVVFTSDFFRNRAENYLAFKFTDQHKKPSFAIRVPADANASELKEAANLRGYFDFTAGKGITVKGQIPLLKGSQSSSLPVVSIEVGRSKTTAISMDGSGNILLSAPDPVLASEMMKALNYVMDRRYPYFFKAVPFNRNSREVIRKFDLTNHSLPWNRCFENGAQK